MSFASDVSRFRVKLGRLVPAVHSGIANRMLESIKGNGSPDPLTGAPGQPVDSGFLRNSWQSRKEGDAWVIGTNVAYARVIEDNNRAAFDPRGKTRESEGLPQRPSVKSKVGGHHSVKLTITHASRIQDAIVRLLRGTP